MKKLSFVNKRKQFLFYNQIWSGEWNIHDRLFYVAGEILALNYLSGEFSLPNLILVYLYKKNSAMFYIQNTLLNLCMREGKSKKYL